MRLKANIFADCEVSLHNNEKDESNNQKDISVKDEIYVEYEDIFFTETKVEIKDQGKSLCPKTAELFTISETEEKVVESNANVSISKPFDNQDISDNTVNINLNTGVVKILNNSLLNKPSFDTEYQIRNDPEVKHIEDISGETVNNEVSTGEAEHVSINLLLNNEISIVKKRARTLENNTENGSVASVTVGRSDDFENKICHKMLGTREKLYVFLKKEDLQKLQTEYVEQQGKNLGKNNLYKRSHSAKFWCKICRYALNDKYGLTIHILENHKEVAAERKLLPAQYMMPGTDPDTIWYKCLDCNFITKSKFYLNLHSTTHKALHEVENFRCAECSFVTKVKAQLSGHFAVHSKRFHKCPYCDFQSKHLKGIQWHVKMVHEAVDVLQCSKCSFQTKYKTSLRKHVHAHSKIRQMYKCPLCPFESVNLASLKYKHMLRHKPDEETKIYKCDFCPFKGKSSYARERHMLTHKSSDEVQMHKCTICSFETKHKSNMKKHVRNVHTPLDELKNMHPCSICPYQGKTASLLKSHIKYCHTKLEDSILYTCSECPYQSKSKKNVKRHSLKHRKGGFQCDKCEYRSNYEDRLKAHNSNTHEGQDIRWIECDRCEYQARTIGYLKRHVRQCHRKTENFSCDQCSFTACTKDEISVHMQEHMNEFLKCDKCDYKNKFRGALHRHRKAAHS